MKVPYERHGGVGCEAAYGAEDEKSAAFARGNLMVRRRGGRKRALRRRRRRASSRTGIWGGRLSKLWAPRVVFLLRRPAGGKTSTDSTFELSELSPDLPELPRQLSLRTFDGKRAAFSLITEHIHGNIPANRHLPELLLSKARVSDESLIAEQFASWHEVRELAYRPASHYWRTHGHPSIAARPRGGSDDGGDRQWRGALRSAVWCCCR